VAEIVPVELRLIEIECVNIGMVRVYAAVEIEVAGVGFIVQSLAVVQTRREIRVDLPTYLARRTAAPCLLPAGRIDGADRPHGARRIQGDAGYAGHPPVAPPVRA